MTAPRIALPVVPLPRHWRANGLLALLLALILLLSATTRADASITWSGAQIHPHWSYETSTSITQELQSIRDAGGNSLRMDIPWDAYEGAGNNQWNQSYLDRVGGWVTQARNLGISPIITLTGTPRWAAHAACPYDPTPTSYDWLQCSPANAADYGDAAARLASQPWGQDLLGIEVWNEPNWQPTGDTNPEHGTLRSPDDAQAEVDMTRAAYTAVKAVRPSVQVITGSVEGADDAFLQSMYQKGLGHSFDVVAMHPYNGNRPPSGTDPANGRASTNPWGDVKHTDWIDGAGRMHNAMQTGGDGAKPIWFTEWGWSTCPTATDTQSTCVTEAEQARYVTKAYDTIRTSLPYVTGAFVYQLRDPPLSSVGNSQREGSYGLVRTDFALKPAYSAWRDAMDVAPPAAPTGMAAVAGNGKATLSWDAVNAADLQNYRVYRKGADGTWPATPLANPTGTSFVDSGLSNGTDYTYRVTAVDRSGNESVASTTVSATPFSYRSMVFGTAGLVSYWRLGESSGTTAVDQKAVASGTYNGTFSLGQPGALVGDADTSTLFDAQTDYLRIPDNAAYRLNGFSVEFEIYLTGYGNTAAWRRVVSKGTSFASRNFLISLKAGTNARLYTSMGNGAGGDVAITAANDLPLNSWTHVVFTHVPGQKVQLYINGQLNGEAATAATPPTGADSILLAADYGDTNAYTPARFDELAIYNQALTASQAKAHYDASLR